MSRARRPPPNRSWEWDRVFPEHVSAAQRRRSAAAALASMKKEGKTPEPVMIEGRDIATRFWGKAWCENLEAYSDYENRLPRGRTYVRTGAVIDLRVSPGEVRGRVMGTRLYDVTVSITPLPGPRWAALRKECAGRIDSVIELLRGELSDSVMRLVTDPQKGLFPSPREIDMSCTCPDAATLCKHVAAVLYGVGARLDARPELLFTLRGVDPRELLDAATKADLTQPSGAPRRSRRLAGDLADIFGIELGEPAKANAKGRRASRPSKASARPRKR